MPTTSRPQSRSTRKGGDLPQDDPIKGIRLTISLSGAGAEEVKQFAADNGVATQAADGAVSFAIMAPTPEEALAQLRHLARVLTRKP